jgi:hypothetical protein
MGLFFVASDVTVLKVFSSASRTRLFCLDQSEAPDSGASRARLALLFTVKKRALRQCQLILHGSRPPPFACNTPTQLENAVHTMTSSDQPQGGAPAASVARTESKDTTVDPVYYTWSNTFSILLGRMSGNRDPSLENKYFAEKDEVKAESYCKRCESNRDYLMKYSPIVTFLKGEVGKLGGDLNSKNVQCRVCTSGQSGGFHIDHGILLCANQFRNRGHQEDTMAHEMVHAWDHLKFKVEDDNLRHQACLEVSRHNIANLLIRLY